MKVLIYPKGDNPYQELLYRELRQTPNSTFTYLDATSFNILFFPLRLFAKRLQGYTILHLHWLAFETNIFKIFGKQLSLLLTLWSLTWMKVLGFKVVWTVHNILPHEPLTSNDRFVARYLSKLSAAKIVHSSATLEQMQTAHLDTELTYIIPHGNYDGVYPDTLTRPQARRRLDIKPDEFVILFFGMIRAYKGIDELLRAFDRMNCSGVRLVIAGECFDAALDARIRAAQKHLPIDYHEGFIDDNEVASYFKACDVVCLPFTAVTTSGSVMLATTFGKPLIAPYLGAIKDIPRNAGLLYSADDETALQLSLLRSIDNPELLAQMNKASREYAVSLSWNIIASDTLSIYEEVLKR